MTKQELKQRTHDFAVRIYNVAMSLPDHRGGQIIARQIIRTGTLPMKLTNWLQFFQHR